MTLRISLSAHCFCCIDIHVSATAGHPPIFIENKLEAMSKAEVKTLLFDLLK